MTKNTEKFLYTCLGFGVAAVGVLAILACVWLLWCFVLGNMWPNGPAQVISPSFWLFAGFWVLLRLVVGFFKRK